MSSSPHAAPTCTEMSPGGRIVAAVTLMHRDRGINAGAYGKRVTPRQILHGAVQPPRESIILYTDILVRPCRRCCMLLFLAGLPRTPC